MAISRGGFATVVENVFLTDGRILMCHCLYKRSNCEQDIIAISMRVLGAPRPNTRITLCTEGAE